MRDISPPKRQRSPHARAAIMFGLTILAAGSALSCGGDMTEKGDGRGPLEPGEPRLQTLEVTPPAAELCGPGNTVQLTIMARDETGAPIPNGAGIATYSSSAPAIARVSSTGVVTAVAPGTAVIEATATLGGITRTASMNATVHQGSAEYPEISGVYDLSALITATDGALGAGAEGTRQTAIITIKHSGDTPLFAGTFDDFRAIDPDGESYLGGSGLVTGSFDCDGRVVIELSFEGSQSSYWGGRGMLASGNIVGTFSAAGGVLGGTFTAERRQAE